jgi:DnaJ family protein A protein 2
MKLYETLGVPRNSSKDDIRRAYKKLAVQNHPDKGGDEAKFKEIANAYDTLMDDNKRALYDQHGDQGFEEAMMGGGGGHHMDPQDIFAQMFGAFGGFGFHRPGGGVQKRNNHVHRICITLDQAYTGLSKNFKVNIRKPCIRCVMVCNSCQGRGSITEMQRHGIFTQTMMRPCYTCQGTGKQAKPQSSCDTCKGNGHTMLDSVHDIKIPAGVCTGYIIKLVGLGEQPQTESEEPGDMLVHIDVEEHAIFTRAGDNGKDLVVKQSISFKDTIVGAIITIPHFTEPLKIDTSKFGIIVPGKAYIIPEKGMVGGNLHIVFDVKYPQAKLSSDERKLIEETFKKCPTFE